MLLNIFCREIRKSEKRGLEGNNVIFTKETNLTLSPGNMDARKKRMILAYILISFLKLQQEIRYFGFLSGFLVEVYVVGGLVVDL